ncbi:MAG: response regulator transcription factor [Bacteroidales bacterium]|nr:response regulator transcription factor [Bacteroidales bacterium]
MNVIIVDDHQIVRDGISVLLMKTEDINIIGEASNGEQLLLLLKNIIPDIIILDISMPKISGIELSKIIKETYPQIKIVIFSSHTEGENVVHALEAGAKGILPKNTIREELIEALRSVYSGKEFISKYIPYSTFVNHIKSTKAHKDSKKVLEDVLSTREIEILKLIVDGKSNKEISELLFISQRTVEKHKSNILNKLEMKSVVDLVKYAIKNKLTDV